MIAVTDIRPVQALRRQCSAKPPRPEHWLEREADYWRARRLAKAASRGQDASLCTHHATHIIDGKPLCARHAGILALAILTELGEAAEHNACTIPVPVSNA